MRKDSILITGANGFVGSHLCGSLAAKGHRVWAYIRKSSTLTEHQSVLKLYSFEQTCLRYQRVENFEQVIDAIEKFDGTTVIHTAGFVSFTERKYLPYYTLNTKFAKEIAEQCLIYQKKLIHFSSIAALGDSFSEKEKITEKTLWQVEKFHSLYATSKMKGQVAVEAAVTEGLRCAILNPGVILDANPFFINGSNRLIHKTFAKQKPYCPNKGTISWVSIRQITQAVERILEANIWLGEKYILVNEDMDYLSFIQALKQKDKVEVRYLRKKKLERLRKWSLCLGWFGVKTITKDLLMSIFSERQYDTSFAEKRLGFKPIKLQELWLISESPKKKPSVSERPITK